jgi:hypothetical protein
MSQALDLVAHDLLGPGGNNVFVAWSRTALRASDRRRLPGRRDS